MACVPSLPSPMRRFKSNYRLLVFPGELCMAEVKDCKSKQTAYRHNLSVGLEDF